MHVLTHMSGHVSGQVPNQAGAQLPGLAQPNGGPLPSQIQNLNMDPDLISARSFIQKKILEKLQQQQTFPEMQPRLDDIVRHLEDYLFRTASSKEEYTNMETLEQRLQTLIKRIPPRNHIQQSSHLLSSSSSIGAMIPTPGMPHSGNSSANIASSVDNYMIASSECNNSISATTVNTGSLLPTANGSSGGIHGGSFNACDGILPNGYQQSPSNISVGSAANNFISSMSVPRMASQMIPTPGFRVIEGEFPDMDELHKYNGFVISGSPFDAFGNELWILRLCFLIQTLDAMEKKILGICFGHQVICRALGGKIGRAYTGWDLGLRKLNVVKDLTSFSFLDGFDEIPSCLSIIECHQDEVLEIPFGAEVIAFSEKTSVEIFAIGDHILGIQGHPEYTKDILYNLVDRLLGNNSIENDVAEAAKLKLEVAEPDRKAWEKICRKFLKGRSKVLLPRI